MDPATVIGANSISCTTTRVTNTMLKPSHTLPIPPDPNTNGPLWEELLVTTASWVHLKRSGTPCKKATPKP